MLLRSFYWLLYWRRIGWYVGFGLIAPGIGFILGFILDMKFMHGRHHNSSHKNEPDVINSEEPIYLASPQIWEERLRENQSSYN